MNSVKTYLKQAVFVAFYHPMSYLFGMLLAGILSVILSAVMKTTLSTAYTFFDPLMLSICPLPMFFIFLFMDGYKSKGTSWRFIILSALPIFIAQHIWLLIGYDSAMIVGSCQIVTAALFPNQKGNTVLEMCLVMLGLQLLLHLPTYLFAYHCGHRYQQRKGAT